MKKVKRWSSAAFLSLISAAGCAPDDPDQAPPPNSDTVEPAPPQKSAAVATDATDGDAIDLIADLGLDGFVAHFKEESPARRLEEAWRIENGMLHITGKGWGYLRTKEAYENYRLVVEYQWGEFTDPTRENRARDSGIFIHSSAKDGAFRNSWPSAFEAQMIEGRAGDVIVIAALDPKTGDKEPHHFYSRSREIRVPDAASDYAHDPEAEPIRLPSPRLQRVRIFRHPRDTDWEDEKGYLGANPIEKPAGEWNRMVIACYGDALKITLNGKVVNVGYHLNPRKGHIGIQSELSECWIRKLKLQPFGEDARQSSGNGDHPPDDDDDEK